AASGGLRFVRYRPGLAGPVPARARREHEHQQEADQEHADLEPQRALDRSGEVGAHRAAAGLGQGLVRRGWQRPGRPGSPARSCGVTVLAAGPAWLPSRPKKTTPMSAMPIELPTCSPVLNTPEAEPASRWGTPASTMSASGAMTAPRPRPAAARPGTRSQVVTAGP